MQLAQRRCNRTTVSLTAALHRFALIVLVGGAVEEHLSQSTVTPAQTNREHETVTH